MHFKASLIMICWRWDILYEKQKLQNESYKKDLASLLLKPVGSNFLGVRLSSLNYLMRLVVPRKLAEVLIISQDLMVVKSSGYVNYPTYVSISYNTNASFLLNGTVHTFLKLFCQTMVWCARFCIFKYALGYHIWWTFPSPSNGDHSFGVSHLSQDLYRFSCFRYIPEEKCLPRKRNQAKRNLQRWLRKRGFFIWSRKDWQRKKWRRKRRTCWHNFWR